VKQVEAGQAADTPEPLRHSPALRALYNNLKQGAGTAAWAQRSAEEDAEYRTIADPVLGLALYLHDTVKRVRPDGWRGVEPRERVIKQALYRIFGDVDEVERLFLLIKAQGEY